MRLALAQIDTTVGDFAGNAERVLGAAQVAAERGANLVLCPELTLTGYPPRDLLELSDFLDAGDRALADLAIRAAHLPPLLVGTVLRPPSRGTTPAVNSAATPDEPSPFLPLHGIGRTNGAAWLQEGEVRHLAHKSLLPNYDVFDERRYFDATDTLCTVEHGGLRLGITICEDLWNDEVFWPERRYSLDPGADLAARGCDWILNLSASPFHLGKPRFRQRMLATTCKRHGIGIAMCNLVGGNDALIFDGHSCVLDAQGETRAQAGGFVEDLVFCDLEPRGAVRASSETGKTPWARPDSSQLCDALVLGLRDYVRKVGFERVVLGLSGGIDSAVTAVLAVRALGPSRVDTVAMPSTFTSDMSNDDAAQLAGNLGVGFSILPIDPVVSRLEEALAEAFRGLPPGVAEENLQARVRGVLLMAISNKHGHLLLTTGNKSELAVGYCTLYGDMAGGLSLIGDLEKSEVYALAEWFNAETEVIPRRILERPPSAELRPDQTDQDSLPPYDVLDPILRGMIVEKAPRAALQERGFAEETLIEVERLLLQAEYKRRQAAPVLRVSERAFGEGWRFPIAHAWSPHR